MLEQLIKENNLKITAFSKNEIIKEEKTVCDSVGIIIEGKIKISNITYSNDEYIIDILSSGSLFGENLIFSSNNFYPGNIISINKSKVIFISKKKFIEILQCNQQFLLFYLNFISNKYIELQKRIKIISQPSIKSKFIYYLQINSINNNGVKIRSITDLALYLNIPRPSLSRVILDLEKNKIIKRIKKYYFLKEKTTI